VPDLPYGPILPDGWEHITPYDITSIAAVIGSMGVPSSNYWPLSNLAIFIPIRVSRTIVTARAFWYNGAAVGYNVDVGIYSADGTNLGSIGSTAQGAANIIVSAALAVTFGPGQFYIAIASNNSSTMFRSASFSIQLAKVVGMGQATSSFALPATVAIATMAYAYVPVFGVTVRSFI
jgi:hypothetical protein